MVVEVEDFLAVAAPHCRDPVSYKKFSSRFWESHDLHLAMSGLAVVEYIRLLEQSDRVWVN